MFTGIVETMGVVLAIQPAAGGIELRVRSPLSGHGLKVGDSVAVNGCCLTIERTRSRARERVLQFSVLEETWRRTNLQFVKAGGGVNLERALRVGDALGGHFVSGHIDTVGKIIRWEPVGKDYLLEIGAPPDVMKYTVFKGSIAVDGISLTVAAVHRKSFELWIIPHTRAVTVLNERRVGDAVNLEADMLGKYVERFVNASRRGRRPGWSAA